MIDQPPIPERPTGKPPVEILEELSGKDLADIKSVLAEVFEWPEAHLARATDLPGVVASPEAALLVSRDHERQVVGVTIANIVRGAITKGEINNLAVTEAARNQGRGGALLDQAIEWLRHNGARRISLTSRPERTDAHRVYESRGFTIKDTNVFTRDLESH